MKSQTVILITLLSVLAFGCAPSEQGESSTEPQSRDVITIDTGEAVFVVPSGWEGEGDSFGAALVPKNETAENSGALISVFVNESDSADVRTHADLIAKRRSGTVVQLTFDLDGEPAYRISSPKHTDFAEEWIVVQHSGKSYVIAGDSTDDVDMWPVLEQLARSWTWK